MKIAAIVLIALILGAAAVPVAGAAKEISDESTCKDISAAGGQAVPGDNCFDGSTQRRAVVAGLLALAALSALGALVVAGVTAVRGGSGVGFVLLTALSIGLFFGSYAAFRI